MCRGDGWRGECRDAVVVATSRWPMPMVCNLDASHDWLDRLTNSLSFNSRQRQAGAGQ